MTPKRSRYTRRRRNAPGSPPGQLTVDPAGEAPRLTVVHIGADGVETNPSADLASLRVPDTGLVWLNVDGLGDAATLSRIAQVFGLHPLAMEDAVNLHQRPKFEDYDQHDFIVLRMPERGGSFTTEQVSLCLGDRFVVTFQERAGDVFDPVRNRLKNPQSTIRSRGADYLAYALIDAVTDAYFPVLEAFGERLEVLEDEVVARSSPALIEDIHALRHQLRTIRGAVWPLRDMLAAVLRDDGARVSVATRVYLRDCQDHTFQLIDMIETYREIASGLVDIHLSSQANRTNEVMQVLTLIATIFIPLTFVVGVYGMNFDIMPELHWRWGYPAVMLGMAALAAGLTIWFRRKGWLGRRR
jgi:magnesium transporter